MTLNAASHGIPALGLGKARPYVALLIGALHLAVLGALVPSGQAMGIAEPVAVTIEREAEAPAEAAPAAAEPPLPPPAPPEPEAVPAPILAPPVVAKETPAVSVPKAAKIVPPKVIPPKVIPPKKREDEAQRPRREAERRAPPPRATPGEGRAQANSGRAAPAGAGGNSAAYAARVRALLQARANALGFEDVNASVGLSFVISASGGVSSASVSRPSGDFKVDAALRRMLASASFPPPPGGSFSGSVTIRIR